MFFNIIFLWKEVLTVLIVLKLMIVVFFDIEKYEILKSYHPIGISRIYSNYAEILHETSIEKRLYVKYDEIPKMLISTFMLVEDKDFFYNIGISSKSLLRALIENISNIYNKKKFIGASTITQQIIKEFFLTNEISFNRKLKEAIISYKVNTIISKEKILEIYLNQIYLGEYSYGIQMASKNYFNKSISELHIQEIALLASLPKAPTLLNPYKNYNKSLNRRNWIINKMYINNIINKNDKENCLKSKINLKYIFNTKQENVNAFYISCIEYKLRELLGAKNICSNTLIIHSNIDKKIQKVVQKTLKYQLDIYDIEQGYKGGILKINFNNNILNKLRSSILPEEYQKLIIVKINNNNIIVINDFGEKKVIKKENFEWIIKKRKIKYKTLKLFFRKGDIILFKSKILQVSKMNGAIVINENVSGKIISLVGGYNSVNSIFNRATQAKRQAGSLFKVFVYLSAIEEDIALNALIMDSPIIFDLGKKLKLWKPKNYNNRNYGLITIRNSFENSLNLTSIRISLKLSLEKINNVINKYLINNKRKTENYTISLGTEEITLLKIISAYSSVANNGQIKEMKIIDSIYNRHGKLLFFPKDLYYNVKKHEVPKLGFFSKKLTDERSNYQVLSLLDGTIKRGTAKNAKRLKQNFIGKTGTTNNNTDTWFIGMNTDLSIGVFIGYDKCKGMNQKYTANNVALPIFIELFKNLKFESKKYFKKHNLLIEKYTNVKTGEVLEIRDFKFCQKYILETFRNSFL